MQLKFINEMILDENCSIFLTIAGSTSAGGCMNLLFRFNKI